MPSGLTSMQDKFQHSMEKAFEGIEGFSVLVDDIVISSQTKEEHNAIIHKHTIKSLSETCQSANMSTCQSANMSICNLQTSSICKSVCSDVRACHTPDT